MKRLLFIGLLCLPCHQSGDYACSTDTECEEMYGGPYSDEEIKNGPQTTSDHISEVA